MTTRIPDLPELTPASQARVDAAEARSIDFLLVNTAKAFRTFIAAERRAKDGKVTVADRVAALRSCQLSCRKAKTEACLHLFDSMAAEYSRVPAGPEEHAARLRQIAELVPQRLLVRDDDQLIKAAIDARILRWEDKRTSLSGRLVPPPAATNPDSPKAIIDEYRKLQGWTLEQVAQNAGLDIKQLYKVRQGKPVRTDTIGKLAGALGCQTGDLIHSGPTLKGQL